MSTDRNWSPLRAAVACAIALLAVPLARAEVVDIAWSTANTFERSVSVAPGKFAEFCGPLKAGEAVQWRFDASQPLDFNIHFHEGKAVHYPARADQTRELQGTLAAAVKQDHCWMWTNKTASAATLNIRLHKP